MNHVTIYTHLETDMGEKVHAQKCIKLLGQGKLVDIPSFVGIEKYERNARLNLSLAEAGHEPITHEKEANGLEIALTWSAGLSALYGNGINPQIAKLYTHLKNERILKPLYNNVRLIITESLLANERALAYGLENTLYIPHHFTHTPKKTKRLDKRVVIGCVSRFEYWKNVEFALDAVKELAKRHDVLLILKGNHPQRELYPKYHVHLQEKLELYSKEGWLKWDSTFTPYPEVLAEYADFDFCIQPSGSEGASNTVVELLAMGIPVIVLNTSSNPYLFQEGALFAEAHPEVIGTQLPFHEPILSSLIEQTERLMDEKERRIWAGRAQKIAFERFHPSIAKRRLTAMLNPSIDAKTLKKFYDQDRALYRL